MATHVNWLDSVATAKRMLSLLLEKEHTVKRKHYGKHYEKLFQRCALYMEALPDPLPSRSAIEDAVQDLLDSNMAEIRKSRLVAVGSSWDRESNTDGDEQAEESDTDVDNNNDNGSTTSVPIEGSVTQLILTLLHREEAIHCNWFYNSKFLQRCKVYALSVPKPPPSAMAIEAALRDVIQRGLAVINGHRLVLPPSTRNHRTTTIATAAPKTMTTSAEEGTLSAEAVTAQQMIVLWFRHEERLRYHWLTHGEKFLAKCAPYVDPLPDPLPSPRAVLQASSRLLASGRAVLSGQWFYLCDSATARKTPPSTAAALQKQ